MQTVTTDYLQSAEALQGVPVEELQWLIDNSTHYELGQGEFLFKTGELLTGTHIIISGRVRVFLNQNKGTRTIGFFEANSIIGYLPFSRAAISTVSGEIMEPTQIITYPVDEIKELINHHYEITQALVHVMTTRVRDFMTVQQQNEKMMALGKLSAGLAHELNNPAAAIVRGSTSLLKHIRVSPETFKEVIAIKMTAADVDKVSNKLFEVLARKEKPVLTLMQRSAMEEDFAECLKSHMVTNIGEIAENFIEFGFTSQDVEDFALIVPPEYLPQVLNWVNNNLVTEKMVNDIQESSQRISKLVSAVKNYTHMDRGYDKEYIDIHSGISNTLTMLTHKINKGNVQLVEDYDTSLPPVKAFVGELNQVWTNLIDNALDAMEVNTKGLLSIKTKRDMEYAEVTITDDGPGIPTDITNQIFDPFFTTKEIGKGTGLGLDVVSKIVRQHGGEIKLNSEPGKTTFAVCFPIDG